MWRSKEKLCYHYDYESERRIHHYVQTDNVWLSLPRRRNRISLFSASKAIGNASMLEETDPQLDLYANGVLSQQSDLGCVP